MANLLQNLARGVMQMDFWDKEENNKQRSQWAKEDETTKNNYKGNAYVRGVVIDHNKKTIRQAPYQRDSEVPGGIPSVFGFMRDSDPRVQHIPDQRTLGENIRRLIEPDYVRPLSRYEEHTYDALQRRKRENPFRFRN